MTAFDDAQNFYASLARDDVFLEPHAVTMVQLKAVTAENKRLTTLCARADAAIAELRAQLAKSFPPPPRHDSIVNIDGGDLILPIMDGPWKGQYLSWRPELGREKHLRYPEPRGSHFIIGRESGRLCWWTLKQ